MQHHASKKDFSHVHIRYTPQGDHSPSLGLVDRRLPSPHAENNSPVMDSFRRFPGTPTEQCESSHLRLDLTNRHMPIMPVGQHSSSPGCGMTDRRLPATPTEQHNSSPRLGTADRRLPGTPTGQYDSSPRLDLRDRRQPGTPPGQHNSSPRLPSTPVEDTPIVRPILQGYADPYCEPNHIRR